MTVLLEKLCSAASVSGDEGEVRKIVQEELAGVVEVITVDALGNVLATKKGRGRDRLRVMVSAHMDEVGFMITGDDKEGIFRFDVVGSLDASELVGKSVTVAKARTIGVVGFKPIHLTTAAERRQEVAISGLRIDIGGGANVKVGDRGTFAPNFIRIGRGANQVFRSKALDNRIGVATLIELLQNPPATIDLLAAFTTQEEIGVRGAQVAAYHFEPDLAIALDVSPAQDLPHWQGEENVRYNTRLGAGPAIYTADGGTLSDPRLLEFVLTTARKYRIPHQIRQAGGGGTDVRAIHKTRAGVPSISISVPTRYTHTAAGLLRRSDWRNMQSLVSHTLADLRRGLLLQERA